MRLEHIRRINLKNTANLRELGGYMRYDFKVTKYKEFLRSGSLAYLDKSEMEYLKDYGVKTVIDLRSERECSLEPSAFERVNGIKYINFSIFEDNTPYTSKDFSLGDLYEFIFYNSKTIGPLFNLIADNSEGTLLYNCTAGKDRTGMVTAVLFLIAGVDMYDIIADYEVSFTYFRKIFDEELKKFPDMPMHFAYSKAEWIENFMGLIHKNYKDVDDFLISRGTAKESIDIIRNKLI